ncbi:MAG: OmpA family protein, partial [Mailhella sp.]|nr:OmpA family protein [Mailhella sp.]
VLDEGTITLTIGDNLLFAPGSEELSPEADEQLKTVLDVIESNREMTVNIKGYTDDSAIPEGARFKNNWELSALRAVNVLRWLVEHGIDPLRVTATGMGDLNPRFPNDSPENRAKNRRVEFCLERQVLK